MMKDTKVADFENANDSNYFFQIAIYKLQSELIHQLYAMPHSYEWL